MQSKTKQTTRNTAKLNYPGLIALRHSARKRDGLVGPNLLFASYCIK